MDIKKRYFYKMYSPSGTYINTLKDVSTKYPNFSKAINSGVGELRLQIARSWEDLSTSTDLTLYNEIKVYVSDKDNSNIQIYSGYLNAISRKKDTLGNEMVEAQFYGYVSELAVRVLEFTSGTALAYNSEDPTDIMKSIIDLYAGKIDYSASSMLASGNTVSLVFNINSIKDAIDKTLASCPIGWNWYVDGSNVFWLRRTDKESIDHRLFVGKDINQVEINESMENVRNDILLVGGSPDGENKLFRRYYNNSSITDYGTRTEIQNDGRLYNTTSMDFLGKYLLGSQYAKEYQIKFKVIDNNVSSKGYDIESIEPGDIIKINDPKYPQRDTLYDIAFFDIDYWDYNIENPFSDPIIVEEVRYNGIDCDITASRLLRGIGFRLADVKRNLENYLNALVPTDTQSEQSLTYSYNSSGDLVDN
jgi:hypothetical protein